MWVSESPPSHLHLPHFTFPEGAASNGTIQTCSALDESHSQPFAFSALFQSSEGSSVGLSFLHSTHSLRTNIPRDDTPYFIGFSWGPTQNALPSSNLEPRQSAYHASPAGLDTPRPNARPTSRNLSMPLGVETTPAYRSLPFAMTPIRPNHDSPFHTMPRMNTQRRASRRTVSDRVAMNQLVDCIGLSARKKVLESGRKPRILTRFSRSGTLKLKFPPSRVVVGNHTSQMTYPSTGPAASPSSDDTDTDGPPSPSPQPGSAMSMMSRRTGTPTMTGSYSQRSSRGTI
jgi:hypothetical protein